MAKGILKTVLPILMLVLNACTESLPGTPGGTQKVTFIQGSTDLSRNLDLLFVLDASASMQSAWTDVVDNLNSYIQRLLNDFQFRFEFLWRSLYFPGQCE